MLYLLVLISCFLSVSLARPRFYRCQQRWEPSLGDAAKPAASCWDIVMNNQSQGSGFYWIRQPNGERKSKRLFQVYCDMDTDGGGWSLAARITDDASWICSDLKGARCTSKSRAPPTYANLFHKVHARSSVRPEFVGQGADSGVHLPLSLLRQFFQGGKQAIRFSFYSGENLYERPVNDGVVYFKSAHEGMFGGKALHWKKGQHYEFDVLRHHNRLTTSFTGDIVCWLPVGTYRYGYEGGLFMGKGSNCHLSNHKNAVQLKSHYTYKNGRAYYSGFHGFLKMNRLQVAHDAIMIWIR